MANIITIPYSSDNYAYLICSGPNICIVDPGDPDPVLAEFSSRNLKPQKVLLTHHHGDHCAGAAVLKKQYGCSVVGSVRSSESTIDTVVSDGDTIQTGNLTVRVIATPGHTRDSLCYYLLPESNQGIGACFTGDTLFGGGCGRLFESDARTMWQSLRRLSELPQNTRVYFGHEYTVDNLEFALSVDPNSAAIIRRLDEARKLCGENRPTTPSTIGLELATNILLCADSPEKFAELRTEKDRF